MNTLIVRYKVKRECAAENEALIRAVFAELRSARPDGLRYASYTLDDGVSFVHLASVDRTDGVNPLTGLGSFKAFQRGLADRCEDRPVATSLRLVDAYLPS